MNKLIRKSLTVMMAATVAVAALAPAAYAQTDTAQIDTAKTDTAQTDTAQTDRVTNRTDGLGDSLERIKAAATTAIDHRFDTLNRLTAHVQNSTHVTDAHAASLLADYQAAESGLSALGEQIAAADSVAEALELSVKIAVDYRVYLVVAPKSAEVLFSDTVVGLVARFEETGVRVQAAIDAMAAAGFDTTEAQALLDGALADAAQAEAVGGPVAGSVIGLSASDWSDPAESILKAGRDDLEEARDHGRNAVDGMRAAIAALKQSDNR